MAKKKENNYYLPLWKPQMCKLLEAEKALLGNATGYLLEYITGFSCGCCFLPLGPPQTIRATGVRMATTVAEGEHVMGSRALPASQERTQQGGRRRVGWGR